MRMHTMISSLALHTDSEEEIDGTCCRLGLQTSVVRSLYVCPSVRLSACYNSAQTGRIFIMFDDSVKNNGYLTCRPTYIYDHVSLIPS